MGAAKGEGKNCVRPYSDDRREFVRIETGLVGRVNALADASHPIRVLNVSEGGLLLGAERPLKVGSVVQLMLNLAPEREPVECLVRVVRVIKGRDAYEVGVKIIDMERSHRRRFLQLVARRPPTTA